MQPKSKSTRVKTLTQQLTCFLSIFFIATINIAADTNSVAVEAESNNGHFFARQFLQTTSTSQNITNLTIINTSEQHQIFKGTLWNGEGTQQGSETMLLGKAVPPMGRINLSSEAIENIFGIGAWKGPAILRVEGGSNFDLISKLISPSGLISNTNCVREGNVLNVEGFDSTNMTFIRLINTNDSDTGVVIGTLYDPRGNVVGRADSVLATNLTSFQQLWLSRKDLANKVGSEWSGEALLELSQIDGLKLLNLNYITDEKTFFNFSCFEDSDSARVYLQTTSTSQNVSFTHLVNTSDADQQFFGTLFNRDGHVIGFRNQPLHFDVIPPRGRLIISSEDIESAFGISPWSGPAMLEVKASGTFELMTKLTSPSGLTSNTNCVRKDSVHNIGGFDQSNMSYIRFINIGDTPIRNIRGSIYNSDGNSIGDPNIILISELPPKAQVWRNRNELSSTFGDTWNDTAALKITNPDANLRLINLVYVNNATFFNFSCYETGL